jgi:hypothetical protein
MIETKNEKKNKTKNLTRVRKTGGIRKRPNARHAKKQAIENKFKEEFTSILEKINNCIREATLENTTADLVNYLNQSLVLIFSELRPQELHRKSKKLKNIKYLRKNWNNILALILKQKTDTKTYTFHDSFKFYSKNLSEYGMKYISLCYKRLYDGLLSKAYSMKPTDDQKPKEDDLKLSMTRLGFEGMQSDIMKEDLYRNYFEKTLEYHMDTPNAMREPEKYKILRKRVRKALVTLELYLDYFTENYYGLA